MDKQPGSSRNFEAVINIDGEEKIVPFNNCGRRTAVRRSRKIGVPLKLFEFIRQENGNIEKIEVSPLLSRSDDYYKKTENFRHLDGNIVLSDTIYEADLEVDDDENLGMTSLNTILFGPPGTGKTFNSVNKALGLLDIDLTNKTRAEAKDLFDQKVSDGQIVFTTFHQSLSYEDFIEGIKPLEPKAEGSPVTYIVEDGIFKRLCKEASGMEYVKRQRADVFEKADFYKMSLGGLQNSDLHDWCVENNRLVLGWGQDINFESFRDVKSWVAFRDKFIREYPDVLDRSKYEIQAMFIFQKMKIGDIVVISKGNKVIDAIGRVTSEYYYEDSNAIGYYQFRDVEWLATNLNKEPSYFFNKKISQQSIYEFNRNDIKINRFVDFFCEEHYSEKRYVLIIDEINRGNVSQIFGELITLIEDSKRAGKPEALEVILPYSKTKFSVPANVYIIGTMNTADRSVEALDTALRRRFAFEEMMPDYTLPQLQAKVAGVNITKSLLLKTINKRIELLKDRDHQIGHAYLIDCETIDDLRLVFKDKIVPLLQEYFYGDYEKMQLVIGKGFVGKETAQPVVFAEHESDLDGEYLERDRFFLKKEAFESEEAFKAALASMNIR